MASVAVAIGVCRFVGKIIGIVGIQKQQAKCWHNRSEFEQNELINKLAIININYRILEW